MRWVVLLIIVGAIGFWLDSSNVYSARAHAAFQMLINGKPDSTPAEAAVAVTNTAPVPESPAPSPAPAAAAPAAPSTATHPSVFEDRTDNAHPHPHYSMDDLTNGGSGHN